METIRPDLIVAVAKCLQNIDLSIERSQVLAEEVSKLNADILALEDKLRLSDEPSDFAVVLLDRTL